MAAPQQLMLQLPPRTKRTLCDVVREIMLIHEWVTPYFVQQEVERKTGEWHSDSTITARIRDLRKPRYGYVIEHRDAKPGRSIQEYKIVGKKQ
jgi:hypothetical protein